MINKDVAWTLSRIADLLEIDGADGFRINSYRRAARTVEDATEDIAELACEGKLTSLQGIGKSTAARIKQYVETGHIDVLDELDKRLPADLLRLLDIQGLGPKKVAQMHKDLSINGLDDLKAAIESGDLAKLAGFGATSVKKIADGIAFMEASGGRTPLGIAWEIAQDLAQDVRLIPGVVRVDIAGSLRRGVETVGDVDLLCEAEGDGTNIVEAFTKLPGVKRVLAAGKTKGSVTIGLSNQTELQIDLRVVPGTSFGAAQQYFTGSKEHNVRLREIAVGKNLRLNEYGLFDGETCIAGDTEARIYKKLGVPFVVPELREDRGEFEPGGVPDNLVAATDIQGDLHVHSTASDGHDTIEEMAHAAKENGYSYLAICDHSAAATIANGLSVDRMWQHIEDIRQVDKKIKGFKLLVGTECDILPNGDLDYPDELLAACDWVMASIHSAMGSSKSRKMSPTDRTIGAMENPYVCGIGHPTGRQLGIRPPMDIDMATVIEAAARTGTLLEINAGWQRLDLKDLHIRQAKAAGVKMVINTDSHSTDTLRRMEFGITTARRGGATTDDIANCLPWPKLKKLIEAKRKCG